MDIPKTNLTPKFVLNDSDEIVTKRKRTKKSEESVIVSKTAHIDSICSLLEDMPAPPMPDLEVLRKKIANNEYQIDYEKLAESMLRLEQLWVG